MDNKITKKRFNNFISYEWGLMILAIAGAIVLWSLLFTMLAPRITSGQEFYLYIYGEIGAVDGYNVLDEAQSKGYLSYDVRKLSYTKMDLTYGEQQMSAFLGADQGDVMLLSKEKEGRYAYLYYDIERLIADAKNYLEQYGNVTESGYEINEDKLSLLFSTRKAKDKRFKTEQEKANGLELERARLLQLYESTINVERIYLQYKGTDNDLYKYGYIFEDGTYITEEYFASEEYVKAEEEPKITREEYEKNKKPYLLDMSKLTGGKKVIESWYTYSKDEEGKDEVKTVDGLYFVVLNFSNKQPHLQYETLTFLDYILKEYTNFTGTVQ